jgi:hypothetical protein
VKKEYRGYILFSIILLHLITVGVKEEGVGMTTELQLMYIQ